MNKLKVYAAGKVSRDWRDDFCEELSRKSGYEIINLDPSKSDPDFDLDANNAELIVGRDCFMIKHSDFVVVNLTDDISVGGSQEMLIAKYYNKPLVGVAPKDGKFYKTKKEIRGREYKNYMHPFVKATCDRVVEDIGGVAEFVKEYFSGVQQKIKGIEVLDELQEYYERKHHPQDKSLHFLKI